jgi:hypothetical protein
VRERTRMPPIGLVLRCTSINCRSVGMIASKGAVMRGVASASRRPNAASTFGCGSNAVRGYRCFNGGVHEARGVVRVRAEATDASMEEYMKRAAADPQVGDGLG